MLQSQNTNFLLKIANIIELFYDVFLTPLPSFSFVSLLLEVEVPAPVLFSV